MENPLETNNEMLARMSFSDLKAMWDYIDNETDYLCQARSKDDLDTIKIIEEARNEMVFLQQEMEKRRNELFFKQ